MILLCYSYDSSGVSECDNVLEALKMCNYFPLSRAIFPEPAIAFRGPIKPLVFCEKSAIAAESARIVSCRIGSPNASIFIQLLPLCESEQQLFLRRIEVGCARLLRIKLDEEHPPKATL